MLNEMLKRFYEGQYLMLMGEMGNAHYATVILVNDITRLQDVIEGLLSETIGELYITLDRGDHIHFQGVEYDLRLFDYTQGIVIA